MPRVNVDELLSDRSEHNNLLEKKQLTDILKAYKVKVIGNNGQVREEFLYQEASDVIARINQLSDIDGQLRALTMVSQSSYEDGLGNLAQALLVLTKLAVIHRNLENGASFTLVNQPYHGGDDWGVRGAGLNEGSVIERKVEVLRNEAERAVLARCFPGKEIDEGGDRDEMIAELLMKLIEEKDYQKVLLLGRLASYFAPKKSLFPTHEILAMQHYLDGVRQLEELSEPRLATGNFQQAAALRSSIIPVADLTQRLHQLKKEQPAEYEQGTSDALKPERAGIAPISQQLMMQARATLCL